MITSVKNLIENAILIFISCLKQKNKKKPVALMMSEFSLTGPALSKDKQSASLAENGYLNDETNFPGNIIRDRNDEREFSDGYNINDMHDMQQEPVIEEPTSVLETLTGNVREIYSNLIHSSNENLDNSETLEVSSQEGFFETASNVNTETNSDQINGSGASLPVQSAPVDALQPSIEHIHHYHHVIDLNQIIIILEQLNRALTPLERSILTAALAYVPVTFAARTIMSLHNNYIETMDPIRPGDLINRRQFIIRMPRQLVTRFPNLNRIRFNTGMSLTRARLSASFVAFVGPAGLILIYVINSSGGTVFDRISDSYHRNKDRSSRNFIPLIFFPKEALTNIWDLACLGDLAGMYLACCVFSFVVMIYYIIELPFIIYVRLFGFFDENYFNIKLLNWYLRLINNWSKEKALKFNLTSIHGIIVLHFIPFSLVYYYTFLYS